ncbi:hypothetical protein BU14_0357s0003 [Porphyra umbilicalis]|uniref:Uncharacterized protein n=1 Tax=Porphyra umbilicalis TaxID=2786 RepID=A0A1X6NXQ5_PORUM|nr:hypothetical protein BU14_0357s0003 [Porphyra umbilicalis]|eukprot:OSX73310.1 hypothetical protein BU14_0357s0003 [Porphyra umbilicalis]
MDWDAPPDAYAAAAAAYPAVLAGLDRPTDKRRAGLRLRAKPRPRLVALAATNGDDAVAAAAAAAFAALDGGWGGPGSGAAADGGFDRLPAPDTLRAALDALCVLVGVGPATASAVLAAARPAVPFMSDEAAVVADATRGRAKAYTVGRYVALAGALGDKATALNAGGGGEATAAAAGTRAVAAAGRSQGGRVKAPVAAAPDGAPPTGRPSRTRARPAAAADAAGAAAAKRRKGPAAAAAADAAAAPSAAPPPRRSSRRREARRRRDGGGGGRRAHASGGGPPRRRRAAAAARRRGRRSAPVGPLREARQARGKPEPFDAWRLSRPQPPVERGGRPCRR